MIVFNVISFLEFINRQMYLEDETNFMRSS